ncbi:MAG: transposase, partial [Methylocella sp.]
SMNANLFWFDDRQGAKIVPLLPANQPGPERKVDRRILSGIMHVLKAGCRWRDCTKEYGPHKTVYNRFSRWSEKGVWQRIFEAVAAPSAPPKQAALDSRHVKVPRCASGGPFDKLRRANMRNLTDYLGRGQLDFDRPARASRRACSRFGVGVSRIVYSPKLVVA